MRPPVKADMIAETTTLGAVRERLYDPDECEGLTDDTPVIILRGWCADDGHQQEDYPDADSGEEAAQRYVDGGCWDRSGTDWIDVMAWRVGYVYAEADAWQSIALDYACHTITLDPIEPPCTDGDHDWQSPHSVVGGIKENPGVWGHGGGVIVRDVCAKCGMYRITDTWAQRKDTGDQGLRSVKYAPADDASLSYARAR